MVIIGKSFKPAAWGVPAVKAQTSTRAWHQGRTALGSASGGGSGGSGAVGGIMGGTRGTCCSSFLRLVRGAAGCHVLLGRTLG